MAPTIICIEGSIGVGKSTIIKKLKDFFPCFDEPIEEWTLISKLYSDMKTYAAPFQFQVLLSQHNQYQSFKDLYGIVIVERCPWTSKHVFNELMEEEGLFTQEQTVAYDQFYRKLKFDVDHYIYLHTNVDVAWNRIQERKKPYDQNITRDYLDKLYKKYEEQALKRDAFWLNTTESSVDEVVMEVRKIIFNLV